MPFGFGVACVVVAEVIAAGVVVLGTTGVRLTVLVVIVSVGEVVVCVVIAVFAVEEIILVV